MKKYLIGAIALIAVAAAAKMADSFYEDVGTSCRMYGGTPDPRGWFKEAPACAWAGTATRGQLVVLGVREPVAVHASRWCGMKRGLMQQARSDELRCVLAKV